MAQKPHDLKAWCRRLADDPVYRAWYLKLWREHPEQISVQERQLIYAYGYGKPIESHEHSGKEGGPILVSLTHEHRDD